MVWWRATWLLLPSVGDAVFEAQRTTQNFYWFRDSSWKSARRPLNLLNSIRLGRLKNVQALKVEKIVDQIFEDTDTRHSRCHNTVRITTRIC